LFVIRKLISTTFQKKYVRIFRVWNLHHVFIFDVQKLFYTFFQREIFTRKKLLQESLQSVYKFLFVNSSVHGNYSINIRKKRRGVANSPSRCYHNDNGPNFPFKGVTFNVLLVLVQYRRSYQLRFLR
jgi:hypothetical protein